MPDKSAREDNRFPAEVHLREKRKLRARKSKPGDLWFGLGMFGMVGWSQDDGTAKVI